MPRRDTNALIPRPYKRLSETVVMSIHDAEGNNQFLVPPIINTDQHLRRKFPPTA
jgi:hypothetical protein